MIPRTFTTRQGPVHCTFDGRIQPVEHKPRMLEHPPLGVLA